MARINVEKYQRAVGPIIWILLGPPLAWAIVVIAWVLIQEALHAFNG